MRHDDQKCTLSIDSIESIESIESIGSIGSIESIEPINSKMTIADFKIIGSIRNQID